VAGVVIVVLVGAIALLGAQASGAGAAAGT
jgi:hypothetical protein